MHRLLLSLASGLVLTLTASCTDQPLLFSSGQTFGVNISVSSASTNPVDLTLGYKSLDATFVPVTSTSRSGGYHAIRGCYVDAVGSTTSPSCSADGTSIPLPSPSGQGPTKPSAMLRLYDTLESKHLILSAMAAAPLGPVLPQAPVVSPAPQAPVAGVAGTSGMPATQAQSMADSLSVFSSFNGNATASGTSGAGVGLGKVFATGVAAQQLTEGQNFFLQYKGQALAAAPACLANLTTAVGAGKVTASELAVCGAGAVAQ